ncbi:MAG TPA: hypothetical protein VMU40_04425 [Steroidobacteraceae bacterium]|nr:hypothetical protein [Steroidobacteraceae bacterium]
MNPTDTIPNPASPAPVLDPSLVTYTHVIYALHALSAFIGFVGAAGIVTHFIFGLPSIVAVIMNYARRSAVRGTLLESHFRWQIRTFWFALLAWVIVSAVSIPLMLVLVGFATLVLGMIAIAIWLIYRIARGWIALNDRRPMYV